MDDWLEHEIRDVIWQGIRDAAMAVAGFGESHTNDFLKTLTSGQELSKAPLLVKVIDVSGAGTDADPGTMHLLIRGPVGFSGQSLFMRIELTASRHVDLTSGGPPVTITDWHTVVGELKLTKEKVFEASLGLGWDAGVWLGRGDIQVIPAGFGLDLFLGGLSDRGIVLGLDLEMPAALPLGSTGLGLKGVGGTFAYNFVPRLDAGRTSADPVMTPPTARDYAKWAMNHDIDVWQAGPLATTAVGIEIRTILVTMADQGKAMRLAPLGIAVLVPGPIFLLGGKGIFVDTDSAEIEGYFAIDIPSASVALDLTARLRMPSNGGVVDARGSLDALFSFLDADLWHLYLGTETVPIGVKVLKDLFHADIYLDVDTHKIAFGASVSIGGEWHWWVIKLTARAGIGVKVLIGWNPFELAGMIALYGELKLEIWIFKVGLSAHASAYGHVPRPDILNFEVGYTISLPWPLPDIGGTATLNLGEDVPTPPTMTSPLLAGFSTTGGGGPLAGSDALAGLQAISGRQWRLADTNSPNPSPGTRAWPDIEIVVPFNHQVIDETNAIVGPPVGGDIEGGYTVEHRLKDLRVVNLDTGLLVPNVTAVWAVGPTSATSRLHVLGRDPFAWLTPHGATWQTATQVPPAVVVQRFGLGPADAFVGTRRFGELQIDAPAGAAIRTDFAPTLQTRVLAADEFELSVHRTDGSTVPFDALTLYVVGGREEWGLGLQYPTTLTDIGTVAGIMELVAISVSLPRPVTSLSVPSGKRTHLVYAVGYREAGSASTSILRQTILVPGHYTIHLDGQSTAAETGVPPAETVSWHVDQDFTIALPESVRAYVAYTTLGDSRIFPFAETPRWNPTMYGFGFPAYRRYRALVRFNVPYLSAIFPSLTLELQYEDGSLATFTVVPVPNADGTVAAIPQSQDWAAAHGGALEPEQEAVVPTDLPRAGRATFRIFSVDAGGTRTKLDEWGGIASRFDDFVTHIQWPSTCVTTFYDAGGKSTRAGCSLVSRPGHRFPTEIDATLAELAGVVRTLTRAAPDLLDPTERITLESLVARTSRRNVPLGPLQPPAELSAPPADWQLPASMVDQLQPLDDDTPVRFGRFAQLSGCRFNGDPASPQLGGLADTVTATTIEGVVDGDGRPYALWLRTPEPLDWRRVTATLTIAHVEQSGGCPSQLSPRPPLLLAVDILPANDATSAFLVGRFAGIATRLPRGQYTLLLRFDTAQAGLVRLRPPAAVGGGIEQAQLTFVQPSGLDWPVATSRIPIPYWFLELLVRRVGIDPGVAQRAATGSIDEATFEALKSASLDESAEAARDLHVDASQRPASKVGEPHPRSRLSPAGDEPRDVKRVKPRRARRARGEAS